MSRCCRSPLSHSLMNGSLFFWNRRLRVGPQANLEKPDGEPKEAWVVDYVDQHGDRHLKTFAKSATPTPITPSSVPPSAPAPIPPTARASPSPRPPSCGSPRCDAAGLERRRSPPIASMSSCASSPCSGRCGCRSSPSRWCAASRTGWRPMAARRGWCARRVACSARCRRRPGARPRGAERRALAADLPPRQERRVERC